MQKSEILEKYKKEEEKIAVAKLLDKIEICERQNKITYTDFLDEYSEGLLVKVLKLIKKDYYSYGGYDGAERKIIIFCPEKNKFIMDDKKYDYNTMFSVIRINIQKEEIEKFNHRVFLGGLIKLGIKREKIGDILVHENGADVIILKEMEKFLYTNITTLNRFKNSKVEIIKLQDLNIRKQEYVEDKIIVPSLRLDNIVSEICRTSRNKTNDIIMAERVLVNGECIKKNTKNINLNDKITIRGKGRFYIVEIQEKNKSGRIPVIIKYFK